MSKVSSEPLLTENDTRYVMFPIQDNDIWKMYKKQVDCFWRAEELDLSKDIIDWNGLNNDEKYFGCLSIIILFNFVCNIDCICANVF